MIQGALDPHVVAAAPVSGTGGFMDTAMRGIVTPVPVLEQVLGPLIVGGARVEPARTRRAPPTSARCAGTSTICSTRSRWRSRASTPSELDARDDGPRDATRPTAKIRCARTGDGGTFRVPIPVEHRRFDRHPGRSTRRTRWTRTRRATRCPGRRIGRAITTWEQAATSYTPVADARTHVHVERGVRSSSARRSTRWARRSWRRRRASACGGRRRTSGSSSRCRRRRSIRRIRSTTRASTCCGRCRRSTARRRRRVRCWSRRRRATTR